jgi:tetratricopeptide (TPR) repeat protein
VAVADGLGHVNRLQGRYARATDHYQQMLQIAQATGYGNWLFEAWQGLGRIRHDTGDPQTAITYHDQALTLAHELGQPDDQARAHDGLAHAHHALNRHQQARHHWRQALNILTDLGLDRTDDKETTIVAIRARMADPDQQGGTTKSRRGRPASAGSPPAV